MIYLRKLSRDEVTNELVFLVEQIRDIYKSCDGEFFSYEYEDKRRWLYKYYDHFTILGIEEDDIVYTTFMVDNNGDICFMSFDDFYASKSIKNEMLVWQEGSDLADSLKMFYGADDSLDTPFNGKVIHHQINSSTGEEMYVSYQTMYVDPAYYYPSLFQSPFYITFVKDGKTKSYIRVTSEYGSFSYDAINFLEQGKGLYGNKELIRYFRVLCETNNGTCIFLPINPEPLEFIDKLIESKGFTRKINEACFAYFNNKLADKEEILALQEPVKRYCKSLEKEKALKYLTQKRV